NRDLKPVTSVTPRADHSPVTSADANALEAGVTDVTPMPVGQEHADAILADIDQQVAEQAEAARDTELQLTLVESDPAPDDVTLPEQVNVAVVLPTPRAQVNEGDEWYTPRWLFDALGIRFSIDVCAPLDRTFSSVPAERHFTIEDDGLAQPWEGTVWRNPPYSKPEP